MATVRADEVETPYYALVREALEEFERGNWEEAYGLFVRAHGMRPSARTLRGMGFAALESRHYVRARRHLLDAQAEARSPLTKQQRADVEKALTTADRFIAHVRLSGRVEPRRVRVDGAEAERDEQGAVLFDPGRHELVVDTAAGPIVHTLDLYGGEQRELALALPGAAAENEPDHAVVAAEEAVQTAPASSATAEDRPAIEPSGRGLRVGGYVLAGVALAAAGGAVAMHLLARDGERDVRDECAPHACTADVVDQKIDDANIQTFQNLSVAGWALAGVSAAAAVTLFWLGRRKHAARNDVAVSTTGHGFVLRGRF